MPDPNTLIPFLTSEVAQILHVSEGTVRLWERVGRLRAVRTARGVRLFDRDEVLSYAAALAESRSEPHASTNPDQEVAAVLA
jgi:excisionase family DNA binding protein